MGFQTDYTQYPAVGAAGMKVDSREDEVESYAAEGAIGFGLAVIKGTDAAVQVKVPAAAGGKFRGVSLRTSVFEQNADGTSGYRDKDSVNVMRKGQAWVPTVGAVTIDAPAFFMNGGANAGKWSATDDGSTDASYGVFRSAVASVSGGLAKLELILPAASA
jgi:hypothetical protein